MPSNEKQLSSHRPKSSSLQVPVPLKKNLSEIEQHSLDYDRLLSYLDEKIKISKSFSERKMLLT
jgi:hypothetical protein